MIRCLSRDYHVLPKRELHRSLRVGFRALMLRFEGLGLEVKGFEVEEKLQELHERGHAAPALAPPPPLGCKT